MLELHWIDLQETNEKLVNIPRLSHIQNLALKNSKSSTCNKSGITTDNTEAGYFALSRPIQTIFLFKNSAKIGKMVEFVVRIVQSSW